MQFEFVVGSTEKHTVRVVYKRWWNSIEIFVDGTSVKKDVQRVWISEIRRVDLRVGKSEIHDVVIEKKRPILWAKFKNPIFKVSVDGSIAHTT